MEKIKLGELLQYIRDDDITVIIVKDQWDKIQGKFPSDSPLLEPYRNNIIDELEILYNRTIKVSFVEEE